MVHQGFGGVLSGSERYTCVLRCWTCSCGAIWERLDVGGADAAVLWCGRTPWHYYIKPPTITQPLPPCSTLTHPLTPKNHARRMLCSRCCSLSWAHLLTLT